MRIYSIAHGDTAAHAARLRAGLAALPSGFVARICGICEGRGEYEQTYTAGCGMGVFRSMGGCDWCDCTGLRQSNGPACDSVVAQVLNAADKAPADAS